MQPVEPLPVKLFCGILYSDEALLERALAELCACFGPIDYRSALFPFTITTYYVPEMGAPIWRLFCSFRSLIHPKELARIKIVCNTLEEKLAAEDNRKVNLDPGYMDYDKVVLASAKYNAHKIYLDFGIYADTTLYYKKGVYHPTEYAFPDFKSGDYNEVFLHIRARFKGQLRRELAGSRRA